MSDFIDKAKHRAEDLIGEAKEKFGNATGNDDLAAEGVADQGEAKVKKAGDAVSDKVSDIKDKFTSCVSFGAVDRQVRSTALLCVSSAVAATAIRELARFCEPLRKHAHVGRCVQNRIEGRLEAIRVVLDFVETEMSDRYQLKLNSREVHGEVQRGMIDRSFQCRQRSAGRMDTARCHDQPRCGAARA